MIKKISNSGARVMEVLWFDSQQGIKYLVSPVPPGVAGANRAGNSS